MKIIYRSHYFLLTRWSFRQWNISVYRTAMDTRRVLRINVGPYSLALTLS